MGVASEVDELSLPNGWTHEKLIREAHFTGHRIREISARGIPVVLGPNEVNHMSSLLGYLAKHAVAHREAVEELSGPR